MEESEAALEDVIDHIRRALKSTPTQTLSAQILHACLLNRYAEDHPSPFGDSVGPVGSIGLWVAGDLAIGRGGQEFNYLYSPVRLVEELLNASVQLTSEPIDVSVDGKTVKHQLDSESSHGLAKTYTIAATVYLLNNLRDKVAEAIDDLFFESLAVVKGLHSSNLDSIRKIDDTTLEIARERFREIIEGIIDESDKRKRKRLKKALWEIDPSHRLANLSRNYRRVQPIWREAAKIYKANSTLTTWQETVKREIEARYGRELPDDLVSLLSKNAADQSDELKRLLAQPRRANFEANSSGIALEHASRLGEVEKFRYGTAYLRQMVRKQELLLRNLGLIKR